MKVRKYDVESYDKPFPSRLRQLLDNENNISPLGRVITQKELAKAFHDAGMPVTRQTISLYANGETKPDLEKFKFIADYFHVSYDYLLGETESTQRETVDIVEQTGLSEKTIINLMKAKNLELAWAYKLVDMILEDPARMIQLASSIVEYTKRLKQINCEIEKLSKSITTKEDAEVLDTYMSFNVVKKFTYTMPKTKKELAIEQANMALTDKKDLAEWKLTKGFLEIVNNIAEDLLKDEELFNSVVNANNEE